MKILPKAIKARVNQLAHRKAQEYAVTIRDATLIKLQGMVDAEATPAELAAALNAIEAEALGSRLSSLIGCAKVP